MEAREQESLGRHAASAVPPARLQMPAMGRTAEGRFQPCPEPWTLCAMLGKFHLVELMEREESILNKRRKSVKEWFCFCTVPSQEKSDCSKKGEGSRPAG